MTKDIQIDADIRAFARLSLYVFICDVNEQAFTDSPFEDIKTEQKKP